MQIYFLLYNARKRRHGMVKWWDLWFAYSKVGGDWQNLSVCTNFRYFNAICHIFIPSLLPIENRLVHLPCNNNLFLTSWPRDTWHQQDQESDPQHKKTSHRACVGAGVAGIHCRVMMSGSWPRTMSQWSAAPPRPAPPRESGSVQAQVPLSRVPPDLPCTDPCTCHQLLQGEIKQ